MPNTVSLKTERLILRNWRESDFEAFCNMGADPEVMRYFPSTLTQEESLVVANKIKSYIEERGWGFWALEIPGQCDFIGFTGLHIPKDDLPCSPCVEVGWRLSKQFWGKGYATEAATASLQYGFSELHLSEIVAFTAATNVPSMKVMQRLGMQNTGKDFDHPDVPLHSNLRRHVLYKITQGEFAKLNSPSM